MLDRVDRILVAVRDAESVARRWCDLVDAVIDRRVQVPALGSRKIVLRLGDAELETHEPTGEGAVASHLQQAAGPLAAGLATADLPGLLERLRALGMEGVELGEGRWYFNDAALGIAGLRVVLSALEPHGRVGLLGSLYECTHLTADAPASAAAIARLFGLDASRFVPIRSEQYGYDGALTLFDGNRLHRIESIDPFDRSKTMGRYFDRFGPSLYMCYAEAPDLAPIRERLKALAPHDWTGSDGDPNGLFIHPNATGSTMMGVSRTSFAWSWSGYPERVVPAPAQTH
ncbi:MAG: hypothetical protein R3E86_01470 [Pseudomonadales bacterium]